MIVLTRSKSWATVKHLSIEVLTGALMLRKCVNRSACRKLDYSCYYRLMKKSGAPIDCMPSPRNHLHDDSSNHYWITFFSCSLIEMSYARSNVYAASYRLSCFASCIVYLRVTRQWRYTWITKKVKLKEKFRRNSETIDFLEVKVSRKYDW